MISRRLFSQCLKTASRYPTYGVRFTSPTLHRYMSSTISLEEAKKMPRRYEDMNNDLITVLSVMGDQEAREERLIREIMVVDNVDWATANKTFEEMSAFNKQGMWLATLPYKIGLVTSVTAAFGSIPLVFDLNSVLAFNERFVTTEIPGDEDLETWLEVGAWAWNWMEPPLGTISFALLCLQFARAQMHNLGSTPYTEWMRNRRAQRLIQQYPKYDAIIVELFAKGDKFHSH